MKLKNLLIPIILLPQALMANDSIVDLSRPFKCPDISPNSMRITNQKLNIGGISYPVYNENASLSPVITNAIFRNKQNTIEINLIQNTKTGKIRISFMEFKLPIDLIPINDKEYMDDTIERYKIYEKVTEDPKSYIGNTNKLIGEDRGCFNI